MSLVCRKALVLAFTISGCSSGSLDTGYVDATAKPLAPRLREGDGFPRVSNGKMLIPTFAFLSINLEVKSCQADEQCHKYLPNLNVALAKNSSVPSAPYCNKSSNSSLGRCTCGKGKCVSYTKEFGRGTILYYCGPCSYVGARCSNDSPCQHELAECRDNFCACKNGGDFFEFSYCEVPHLGFEVAVYMVIVVCIVFSICLVLASSYGIINMHQLRRLPGLLRYLQTQQQCEPATEDLPPKYDDLLGKLPTYEEAIFTIEKNPCVDLCHRNLAFDAEEETDSRYGVDIEAAERANQADQTENHSVPTQPRRAQNDVKNPQSDVERPANPPPYQAQIIVKNPQSDAGRLPNPPLRHAESDVKIPQSDAERLAIPLGFSVDNELINPQSSARSHSPRQHTETPIREILTKHTNS
ncbi:uncharacterized protein [Penaeus vannamei]|uniref:uncharacterized protein n=1 Tax=Penaeus vannamei TaxID=6689 RepID=UPI00387F598E